MQDYFSKGLSHNLYGFTNLREKICMPRNPNFVGFLMCMNCWTIPDINLL